MTTTPRRAIAQTLAVAAAVLALGSAGAQEVKRAKLGHSFADSHPRAAAMKQFAAAVEKATGGKVAIDVFGSATLGSEDKMLIAAQSGTQDLYMGSLAPISARKKEMQIFDFPFIFGSDAEAAHVLDGPVGRKMLDGLGDMNMQGLVWAGGAFRNMSNSKRPLGTHGRHEGPEGARDAKPDGAGELQRDGHERGADGLHRGLPGA